MAKELARLKLRIEGDTAGLKRDLKITEGVARQSGRRMSRAFARASRAAGGLAKSVVSVRGAFVALGGATALGLAIKQSVDFADSIGKTADKIGLTTDSLQELRFAADLAGVEQRTLDLAMQRFARRVGEAAQGTGELKGTLEQYGIEVRNADGSTRSLDDVLDDLADTIAGASSEQEALRIAFKAFDSEGAAFVNALRRGAAGLRETRQAARNLGIVLEESLIRTSEKAADQLTILAQVIKVNFVRGLLGGFLEDFTDFAELVEDPKFAAGIRDLGNAVQGFVGYLIENGAEIGIAGTTLAGLFIGATLGPAGAAAGAIIGLASGLVVFKTNLLTTASAAELLAEEMAKLEEINQVIAREGGIDVARPGLLAERRRELTDILKLEQAIANASPAAGRNQPGDGLGDGLGLISNPVDTARQDKIDAFIASLERQQDAERRTAEAAATGNAELMRRVEIYNKVMAALTSLGFTGDQVFSAEARQIAAAVTETERLRDATKDATAATRSRTDALKRQQLAQLAAAETIGQMIEDLRFETKLILMNNEQRRIATTLRRAELIAAKAGISLSDETRRTLTNEIRLQEALRRSLDGVAGARRQAASASGVASGGGGGFSGFRGSGGDFKTRIVDTSQPNADSFRIAMPNPGLLARFGFPSSSTTFATTINAQGAATGVGAELAAVMRRFEASMPALVEAAVSDARARGRM